MSHVIEVELLDYQSKKTGIPDLLDLKIRVRMKYYYLPYSRVGNRNSELSEEKKKLLRIDDGPFDDESF